MKIWIWSGERYPDYSFKTVSGASEYWSEAEVDPAQIEKWRDIEDKYVAMQEELDFLFRKGSKNDSI